MSLYHSIIILSAWISEHYLSFVTKYQGQDQCCWGVIIIRGEEYICLLVICHHSLHCVYTQKNQLFMDFQCYNLTSKSSIKRLRYYLHCNVKQWVTPAMIFSQHIHKHNITLIFARLPLITFISLLSISDLGLLFLDFSSSKWESVFWTENCLTNKNKSFFITLICIIFNLNYHLIYNVCK